MAKEIITQEELLKVLRYKDGNLYRTQVTSKRTNPNKPAGGVNKHGYFCIQVNKKMYLNHRLIYLMHHGYLPEFIDHIDGNRLNNNIANLRASTRAENNRNAKIRKDNTSGVKGVNWHSQAKKWQVLLMTDKKHKNYGLFDTVEDAKKHIELVRSEKHLLFANHG